MLLNGFLSDVVEAVGHLNVFLSDEVDVSD